MGHIAYKSNQIFHYTRWITPKRVTSLRGPSPHHCAQATQLLSKKCRSGGEPLATLSNLTGPRFKPQTSRSRDERVTARPTGRLIDYIYIAYYSANCSCIKHSLYLLTCNIPKFFVMLLCDVLLLNLALPGFRLKMCVRYDL